MEEIVKLVSSKTGLPEDAARAAVEVVIGAIEQKLPAPIAAQLRASIAGPAAGGALGAIAGVLGSRAG